jgi:hypothetical protein
LLRSLDSSLESKNNPYKLELSSPHLDLLLTMSVFMETSLTSMKAAFPAAPEPIHGISTLALLILHMSCCSLTQKAPVLAKMNMLFLAASPDLYLYFTNEAYPSSYLPFPKEVNDLPVFFVCASDNERKSLKATHACDQKTQADVVMMNLALFGKHF